MLYLYTLNETLKDAEPSGEKVASHLVFGQALQGGDRLRAPCIRICFPDVLRGYPSCVNVPTHEIPYKPALS